MMGFSDSRRTAKVGFCSAPTLSLGQALVDRYGAADGWQTFERIALRSLIGMDSYLPGPGSAYSTVLAADDNNGRLDDGTPNADLIFSAFGARDVADDAASRGDTPRSVHPVASDTHGPERDHRFARVNLTWQYPGVAPCDTDSPGTATEARLMCFGRPKATERPR